MKIEDTFEMLSNESFKVSSLLYLGVIRFGLQPSRLANFQTAEINKHAMIE